MSLFSTFAKTCAFEFLLPNSPCENGRSKASATFIQLGSIPLALMARAQVLISLSRKLRR